DHVVEPVASTGEVARPGESQVLHIGGECVTGESRPHQVAAAAGCFRHDIAGVVGQIDVVARTADHGVGAGAAVQKIVAAPAGNDVGQIIAGTREVAGAGER